MKNKKWMIAIMGVVVLVCGLFFRYKQVNATEIRAVHEKFFQPDELVKAEHINFKMYNVKIIKEKNNVKVTVDIDAKLTSPSNFGFHQNNNWFIDNLWLNIPNGISQPVSLPIRKLNGQRLTFKELRINQLNQFKVTFTTPRWDYDIKNQDPRISLLIPEKSNYEKYSLKLKNI